MIVLIRVLRQMPPGVLGFEAVDDVEEDDYEDVIVPAIDAAVAENGKVGVVFVLGPEFDEYEGEAVWESVKVGMHHRTSLKRVAIVTDARWAGTATKVVSSLLPGQARAFPSSALESAKHWASEAAD